MNLGKKEMRLPDGSEPLSPRTCQDSWPFSVLLWQIFQRRVDDVRDQLAVDRSAPFGQAFLGLARLIPRGIAAGFLGLNRTVDLKQIGKDPNLTSAQIMTQNALGINVRTKMFFGDLTARASLFPGFAGRALAGRHAGIQASFRK